MTNLPIAPTHAPQRRRTDTPRIFDPACATWVNEKVCNGVWRQSYHCPSRTTPAIHTLTCDPDGGRACCDCPSYKYSHDEPPACLHTRAAAEILRVTAYNAFAALTGAELRDLDWATRGQYGQCGIANNLRYDVLGECIAADLRRQDAPTAIAVGKRAVLDLFDEAS